MSLFYLFIDVPTVQLLLKELKDVTDDWKLFGLSLGVPVRNLNTIKLDDPHGGVENWKLKMFEIWLQYKPDASWKDVVRALNEKDYNNLAAKLSRKYLLAADSQGKSYFYYLITFSWMFQTVWLNPTVGVKINLSFRLRFTSVFIKYALKKN